MVNCFVVDVDGTLCEIVTDGDYKNAVPKYDIINKVNEAFHHGIYIYLYTARGMRSFNGNVFLIEQYHRPILLNWLAEHKVKFNELHFGKPWHGKTYYVDDRALSLDQFLEMKL